MLRLIIVHCSYFMIQAKMFPKYLILSIAYFIIFFQWLIIRFKKTWRRIGCLFLLSFKWKSFLTSFITKFKFRIGFYFLHVFFMINLAVGIKISSKWTLLVHSVKSGRIYPNLSNYLLSQNIYDINKSIRRKEICWITLFILTPFKLLRSHIFNTINIFSFR